MSSCTFCDLCCRTWLQPMSRPLALFRQRSSSRVAAPMLLQIAPWLSEQREWAQAGHVGPVQLLAEVHVHAVSRWRQPEYAPWPCRSAGALVWAPLSQL
jgi:hypothetical protein